FVQEIKKYLNDNPGIVVPAERSTDSARPDADRSRMKKKGETVEETLEFFKEGMAAKDIAKRRNLVLSTITSHLERLIRDGRDVDIDRLVDSEQRNKIREVFLASRQWGLNPIIEHFKGSVSYEEARFVRAWMLRDNEHS
ncbi:MAG TPA: hypothetical protein DCP92_08510, partial [Nitrospiraceae bacterium]|nr:hypothetical protein [Nitrospiraceae bacterium]